MMKNSPQIGDIMKYLNKNGGDPKRAFYDMAKDKGENPEDILSQLR